MLTYAKYLSPISLLTQKSWPILYTLWTIWICFLPSYWPRNPDQFYILCGPFEDVFYLPTDPEILTIFINFGPFEDVFTFLLTQKSWPFLYTLWTIWRCFLPSYWPRNPDHFYILSTIWRCFFTYPDKRAIIYRDDAISVSCCKVKWSSLNKRNPCLQHNNGYRCHSNRSVHW